MIVYYFSGNLKHTRLMALVQKLQVDRLTFSEIAEMALSRVLREGEGSSSIDVVFDVCRDLSIKSAERELRSEGDSITFKNQKLKPES